MQNFLNLIVATQLRVVFKPNKKSEFYANNKSTPSSSRNVPLKAKAIYLGVPDIIISPIHTRRVSCKSKCDSELTREIEQR